MNVINIILTILAGLPKLIEGVETIYQFAKGSGPLKKQAVLGAVGAVVDGIASIPGNTETHKQKDAILGVASVTTDAMVSVYNSMGLFSHDLASDR